MDERERVAGLGGQVQVLKMLIASSLAAEAHVRQRSSDGGVRESE